MEASDDKKSGAEERRARKHFTRLCMPGPAREPHASMNQMGPLKGLHDQKDYTAQDGQADELAKCGLIVPLDCRQPLHHGHAAADQQKSHNSCRGDAQHVRWTRPVSAAKSYRAIPSQEGAERHGITHQEDPHPELPPTLGSQGTFVCLGMHCSSFAHFVLSFCVQASPFPTCLWARFCAMYTVLKIEPKIANGMDIRKRILIFKPRASASSPSKQTAQAQAATGSKAMV